MKVSEFIVGQAIPPVSSLASEVFIPISEKLQGILTNLEVAFNSVLDSVPEKDRPEAYPTANHACLLRWAFHSDAFAIGVDHF